MKKTICLLVGLMLTFSIFAEKDLSLTDKITEIRVGNTLVCKLQGEANMVSKIIGNFYVSVRFEKKGYVRPELDYPDFYLEPDSMKNLEEAVAYGKELPGMFYSKDTQITKIDGVTCMDDFVLAVFEPEANSFSRNFFTTSKDYNIVIHVDHIKGDSSEESIFIKIEEEAPDYFKKQDVFISWRHYNDIERFAKDLRAGKTSSPTAQAIYNEMEAIRKSIKIK